ncbi:hypothetical protein H4R33_004355 [Dimargaris cristalligena]|nr:hypothetical protein H4R33_004355 [Dimargaris cristalligena]
MKFSSFLVLTLVLATRGTGTMVHAGPTNDPNHVPVTNLSKPPATSQSKPPATNQSRPPPKEKYRSPRRNLGKYAMGGFLGIFLGPGLGNTIGAAAGMVATPLTGMGYRKAKQAMHQQPQQQPRWRLLTWGLALLACVQLAQSALNPIPHWTDPNLVPEQKKFLEAAINQRRLEVLDKMGYAWPDGPLPDFDALAKSRAKDEL